MALFPTKSIAKKKKWERQKDENDGTYKIFEQYLVSEPRSVENLADKLQLNIDYVRKLAIEYQWDARTLAYDGEQLNLDISAEIIEPKEITIKEMREKHLKIADLAENIAVKGFYFLDRYINDTELAKQNGTELPKSPPLQAKEIIQIAEYGAKLKRLTLGEVSNISEKRTKIDYSKLSDDELKQLKQLADKYKPGEDNGED